MRVTGIPAGREPGGGDGDGGHGDGRHEQCPVLETSFGRAQTRRIAGGRDPGGMPKPCIHRGFLSMPEHLGRQGRFPPYPVSLRNSGLPAWRHALARTDSKTYDEHSKSRFFRQGTRVFFVIFLRTLENDCLSWNNLLPRLPPGAKGKDAARDGGHGGEKRAPGSGRGRAESGAGPEVECERRKGMVQDARERGT